MGCHVLTNANDDRAVFYCSTSDVAFGPVMGCEEEAEKFIKWLPEDPRSYSANELSIKYVEFALLYVCECGTVRWDECDGCEEGTPKKNGKHVEEDFSFDCRMEPPPNDGERYQCQHCKRRARRKA